MFLYERYFLGIDVSRGLEGISLCQCKYALNIIFEVGLVGAKLTSFPIEQNHQLLLTTSAIMGDLEQY